MSDSYMPSDAVPPILPEYPAFSCAAVIVAGGQSSRLGHVPKASLSDGTSTLLDCALQAVRQASPRVVVGPDTLPVPSDVLLTREDPPFSGPAAAIHAGLERVAAQCEDSSTPAPKWCLILGVDTPRIAPAVQLLMRTAAVSDATTQPPLPEENSSASEGFWGISEGIYQPLVGIYRYKSIRSVFSEGTTDASVRSFLRRLNPISVELSAQHTADVDTWEQAEQLGYTTSLWSSY
ncbi:molybdenum cofactor guanylyltransferase [Rothia mucilaginosa]|uniref:molybdenum cofactor guanylyltransferase n=1 Tax=Rothia mucilaginosa TaxID=43675 RepID=UPI001EF9CBC5|nr:NTP transferase domain-containing protein [Rothia mucilaginosa]